MPRYTTKTLIVGDEKIYVRLYFTPHKPQGDLFDTSEVRHEDNGRPRGAGSATR
jgi:hypothetical protein